MALGGVALVALPQIFDRIGIAGALLLLSGGVFYTVGAVVYATRRPDPRPATFGYHEIFHSLVIAAVACQYATVAFYVLPESMNVAVAIAQPRAAPAEDECGRRLLRRCSSRSRCSSGGGSQARAGRCRTPTSGLVAAAASAYLASFFFRALGWQRLFTGERPDRSRCLAACGAAAASGAVLPFRLDYVVKISTLRRLGGVRLGLEAIGLSIISLGLVDAVAMLPLAIAAIVTSGAVFRAPLIVVLLFCLGCIGVLALGPRLVRLPFVSRSERVGRIFTRVGDNAGFSRSMFVASGFLFGCWTMRALGSTFLLSALGVGFSPTLALVVMCLAAAASILPDHRGRRDRQHRRDLRRPARAGRAEGRRGQLLARLGDAAHGRGARRGGVGVGGSLLYTLQRRRFARATIA